MNFDPATVSVDDDFGDRQSQASAGSLATRRVVDASEPIEDEWNLVFRNALPLIGNLDDKFASPGRRRKVYDPTRRSIFCRVVDQDWTLYQPVCIAVRQSCPGRGVAFYIGQVTRVYFEMSPFMRSEAGSARFRAFPNGPR